MKANKLSYEEQVLKLGNGKMLEPGYYDSKMNKIGKVKADEPIMTSYAAYIICPKDAKEMGEIMFSRMKRLQKVILPSNLKTIYFGMFIHCNKLAEIILPDTVECIEEYAFSYSGIESISLPASVKTIKNYAFSQCNKLKSFSMPEADGDVKFGIQTFYGCTDLKTVDLPEGLTQISDMCFKDCKKLEKVIIPDSVESIDHKAFASCVSLRNVKLGAEINYIDSEAFMNVSNFLDIEYKGTKLRESDLRPLTVMEHLRLITDVINDTEYELEGKYRLLYDMLCQIKSNNQYYVSMAYDNKFAILYDGERYCYENGGYIGSTPVSVIRSIRNRYSNFVSLTFYTREVDTYKQSAVELELLKSIYKIDTTEAKTILLESDLDTNKDKFKAYFEKYAKDGVLFFVNPIVKIVILNPEETDVDSLRLDVYWNDDSLRVPLQNVSIDELYKGLYPFC